MIAAVADTRIDWFRVFFELKCAEWSLYRIEKSISVPKTTLIGWKNGAEPKHADGERFIQLWQDVTGKPRDELPIERRFQSAYRRK